jgi:hypothetical protein
MRKLLLTGAALLGGVVTIAACHPVESHHHHGGSWMMGDDGWSHHGDGPVTVAATLNCPDHEGELTRTGMAADGKSCQYQGDDQDVTLSLVALNGQTPQAALGPMEADLRGLVPAHSGSSMVNVDAGKGPDGHDNAKIDMPGFHVDAHGDKAKVSILGVDINADGENDHADIKTDLGMKGTTIHAGPGGAEIRAGDVGQHAADLVFILAGDNPGPSGYRAVGYLARGPADGPLVVGEFKSKDHDHHGHNHDLERLIDLNVTTGT